MPLIKVFLIQHTLSPAEEDKLVNYRQNRTATDGQIQITYRKKRKIIEVEAESIHDAVIQAAADKEEIPELPGVYRKYRTVFAAAEAREGEMCRCLDDAFEAVEQDLPLA